MFWETFGIPFANQIFLYLEQIEYFFYQNYGLQVEGDSIFIVGALISVLFYLFFVVLSFVLLYKLIIYVIHCFKGVI